MRSEGIDYGSVGLYGFVGYLELVLCVLRGGFAALGKFEFQFADFFNIDADFVIVIFLDLISGDGDSLR